MVNRHSASSLDPGEAEDQLRRFIDDPWNGSGKAAAAADYFLLAVQTGKDITACVQALKSAFLTHSQLAVMTPIADALCMHFLARGELESLSTLLADKHFFQYIVDSLRKLEENKVDIGSAIPCLIRNGSGTRVLIAYIRKDKRRLLPVLDAMLAEPSARGSIPGLISDYLFAGASDIAEAMPILVSLFAGGDIKQKEAIAHALRLAAEQGTSLQNVSTQLEQFLTLKNETVQTRISYALTWSCAAANQWQDVDRLLNWRATDVRFGATWALSVRLNTMPSGGPEIASRLALALTDEAATIRNFALNGLKKAEAQGKNILPEREVFDTLCKSAGELAADSEEALAENPASTSPVESAVIDYLYSCCTHDPALAAVVLACAPTEASENSVLAKGLLRACREIEAGTHVAACLICEQLPRTGHYDHDCDVPKAAALLTPAADGDLKRCPQCETYYLHSRTEEYLSPNEGMGSEITITIRRLCPDELLEVLQGEALDAYRLRYGDIIEQLHPDLNHPRAFRRNDAAWSLTRHFLKHSDPAALERLLRHALADVRITSLQTLKAAVEKGLDPLPWREPLLASLTDASREVRSLAAAIIALRHLDQKDYDALDGLLGLEEVRVKQTVLFQLQAAARNGLDIVRFLPVLRRGLSDPDETVRRYARWALEHAPQGEQEQIIQTMIARLADVRLNIRQEALDALRDAAQQGADISTSLPLLVQALGVTETRWHAMKALQAAVGNGADISIALAALVAILGDKTISTYKDDFILLLGAMEQRGHDISASIPALAKAVHDDRLKGLALQVLLRLTVKGVSMQKALRDLESALADPDAYTRQELVKILSTEFIHTRNWKAIAGLLRHARHDVRAVGAQRLGEMKADSIPSDLIALLVGNLLPTEGEFEYRSYCTKGALIALAAADKQVARSILDAMAGTKIKVGLRVCRDVIAACEKAITGFSSR